MKWTYRTALTSIVALSFAPGAWAQGCVLCYTSLAASGPTAMHAFQMAMFALLIPALLLFLGVSLLIFGRARKASEPASAPKRTIRRGLVSQAVNAAEGQA